VADAGVAGCRLGRHVIHDVGEDPVDVEGVRLGSGIVNGGQVVPLAYERREARLEGVEGIEEKVVRDREGELTAAESKNECAYGAVREDGGMGLAGGPPSSLTKVWLPVTLLSLTQAATV
jgi:hypothetical protein